MHGVLDKIFGAFLFFVNDMVDTSVRTVYIYVTMIIYPYEFHVFMRSMSCGAPPWVSFPKALGL